MNWIKTLLCNARKELNSSVRVFFQASLKFSTKIETFRLLCLLGWAQILLFLHIIQFLTNTEIIELVPQPQNLSGVYSVLVLIIPKNHNTKAVPDLIWFGKHLQKHPFQMETSKSTLEATEKNTSGAQLTHQKLT